MRNRILLAPLLCLLSLGQIVSAEPSEMAKRLKQAEADLKKSRESLHVAHQELGEKAEMIAQLKSELEKSSGARRTKSESLEVLSRLKRELQAARAKIKSLENEIEQRSLLREKQDKAPEEDEAKPKRSSSAPKVFKVTYDKNSAANLEGRESALKWIRAGLQQNPKVRFAIRGRANDTEFEVANRAIAENRANFLASFLRVSGVPADAFVEISGEPRADKGAGGRIVEIVELP